MSNTKGEKHLFSFQYLFSISSSLWTEDALKKIVEWDVCIVWPPDDIASTLYSTFSCDIFLLSFYVRERVRMFSIRGISKNVTWTYLQRNTYPYMKWKCIAIEIYYYGICNCVECAFKYMYIWGLVYFTISGIVLIGI